MSDNLGTVAYDRRSESGQYLGLSQSDKNYSEETAKAIDDEIRRVITEAHDAAKSIIQEHKAQVELMTQMLMEFETLDAEDVRLIIEDKWDAEEKRKKMKTQEMLHKKPVVSPPPPPPFEPGDSPIAAAPSA
jgi:cell division protease FtsH